MTQAISWFMMYGSAPEKLPDLRGTESHHSNENRSAFLPWLDVLGE
jgi:hypothetical protein